MKSHSSRILILSIVLSLLIPTVGVTPAATRSTDPPELKTAQPEVVMSDISKGEADQPEIYIIRLEDEPLATYKGGKVSLQATSPVATGADKLDVNSAASRAYRSYLAEERNNVLNQMQQETGHSLKIIHTYDIAYNGMAVELTPAEAAQVAKLPGVRDVIPNFTRYLQTDTTPEFLNAVGIWEGENTGTLDGTMGEGIIVGIIDTGINMDHPSFADVGDDDYDHTNPWGADNYTGWCDPDHDSYDPDLTCNDKLIGVYSYPSSGDDPEDDNSHGSHTASTSAGNVLYDVEYEGYTFEQISGMAPHANIISYDVCTGSGCQGDSIMAAIDNAIADGVDVINYSIGGGPTDPWNDPDSLAYLSAREAGVFVATSAGNDGPGAGTVGSPANSPWMTTVANTTISRILANTVDVTGPGTVPAELEGIGAIRGPEGPEIDTDIEADIVYSGDVDTDNVLGCDPFPTDVFTNSIALIQRGDCAFADKVDNAADASAIAVIIFNNSGGPPMSMGGLEDTTIPSVFITLDDGEAMRDWVQAEDDPTARINAGVDRVLNPEWADILAAGSSRGPNVNPNLIKPDIAAPGTNIFAAYAGDPDAFGMMSGTSMASPHVAGAGALMRALHPDWSEAEIQSALMMTSKKGVVKDDATTPVDPFDVGAGRLDLTNAALAGLVLHETVANYETADPALDGDPTSLNLASLGNGECLQSCSWERVFRNTTSKEIEWEITTTGDVPLTADPMTFTIAADATQVVTFTADVSEEEDGVWLFGEVTLTADDPEQPKLHLPVAVLPTSGILPDLVEINTRRNAGSQTIEDVQAIEILNLVTEPFGLTQADMHDLLLDEDPTNSDPYDDLSQVYYNFVTVPAGAKRLVAEVTASEAPDVDLFILYDTGAGFAEVCASTTSSWNEYCDLTDPDAGAYLIVVQNWQGSDDQPDAITLATAVVPGTDADNMDIFGPTSAEEMEPFDLDLFWDTPEMVAGDRWYGAFSLGSEPGSEGNVGTIPVNIIRHEDDVLKEVIDVTTNGDEVILTYQIAVQPNVTGEDYNLLLRDEIPDGLTYVPGSATGGASVVGRYLTWNGAMQGTYEYQMSTNDSDPDCDTGFGGYVNLEDFSIYAQAGITGDTTVWTTFSDLEFLYYGDRYNGLGFTDDGFGLFDDANNYGGEPWVNQNLPDPDLPNNALAAFWKDMEIVYDKTENHGVSLATAGPIAIVEYDNIIPWGGDGSVHFDFEMVVDSNTGSIAFAYDNLNGPVDDVTIGIENAAGTEAEQYAYNDGTASTIYNGLVVCFDYTGPTDPHIITYQVSIDDPDTAQIFINTIEHITDDPGAKWETTIFRYMHGFDHKYFLPLIFRNSN